MDKKYFFNNNQTNQKRVSDIFKELRGTLQGGRSQDGGGIGRGDHFLSYKFIERTIEH